MTIREATNAESISRFKCAKSFVKNSLVALAATVSLVFKTLSFNKTKIEKAYVSTKEKWAKAFAGRKIVVLSPANEDSNPSSIEPSISKPISPSESQPPAQPTTSNSSVSVSMEPEASAKAGHPPASKPISSPTSDQPSQPTTSNPSSVSISMGNKASAKTVQPLKAQPTISLASTSSRKDISLPTPTSDLTKISPLGNDEERVYISSSVESQEAFELTESTTILEIKIFFDYVFNTPLKQIRFPILQKVQACRNRLKVLQIRCKRNAEKNQIDALIAQYDDFIRNNLSLHFIKSSSCYKVNNKKYHKTIQAIREFDPSLNFSEIRARKVLKKIYKELKYAQNIKDNTLIKEYLYYYEFLQQANQILEVAKKNLFASSPLEVDNLVDALEDLTFFIDRKKVSQKVEEINQLIILYNEKGSAPPNPYSWNYSSPRTYSSVSLIQLTGSLSVGATLREIEGKLKKLNTTEQLLNFRKHLWQTSLETEDFLRDGRELRWFSGSNSASLPIIARTAQSIFGLSLVPTGKLVGLANLAPLSGEIFWGTTTHGVNQTSLSGVAPPYIEGALSYSRNKSFAFSPQRERTLLLEYLNSFLKDDRLFSFENFHLRTRIGILRLLLTGKEKKYYPKILSCLNRLSKKFSSQAKWEFNVDHFSLCGQEISPLLLMRGENFLPGELVGIERSSGKILVGLIISEGPNYKVIVEPDGIYKYAISNKLYKITDTKELLSLNIKTTISEEDRAFLHFSHMPTKAKVQDLIDLFKLVKPLQLSAFESQLIQEAFPILWGSRNLEGTYFRSDIRGEHCIRGKAELIKDIQVVFTDIEHIPSARKALPKEMHVLTFDAAHYIRCVQTYEKAMNK